MHLFFLHGPALIITHNAIVTQNIWFPNSLFSIFSIIHLLLWEYIFTECFVIFAQFVLQLLLFLLSIIHCLLAFDSFD